MILYILLIALSPLTSWTQQNAISYNKKPYSSKKTSQYTHNSIQQIIKYYHVEEIVSSKFGGHKTVYNVTDQKTIRTYDLGPNGIRTITPVYKYVENENNFKIDNSKNPSIAIQETNLNTNPPTPIKKSIFDNPQWQNPDIYNKSKNTEKKKLELKSKDNNLAKLSNAEQTKKNDLIVSNKNKIESKKEKPIINQETKLNIANQVELSTVDLPKKTETHLYIDILKTYENMADNGYISIDILKKMGNSYFYKNEFDKAEKWYNKLFIITTDLEPYYYYRYSIVLKSIGNIQKSNEFLKKFNQLSSSSSR